MTSHSLLTNRLLGNLDDFFAETLRHFGPPSTGNTSGAYRYETEDSYRLRIDLPGFTREEITLTLEKNELTIEAKSVQEDPFNAEFQRTYQLAENTDPDGITAKLENGVLDLTFKKLAPNEPESKTITIS